MESIDYNLSPYNINMQYDFLESRRKAAFQFQSTVVVIFDNIKLKKVFFAKITEDLK